ncbi:hypothetical protein VTK26DRAFT_1909 [Humicola hyalothermophila]
MDPRLSAGNGSINLACSGWELGLPPPSLLHTALARDCHPTRRGPTQEGEHREAPLRGSRKKNKTKNNSRSRISVSIGASACSEPRGFETRVRPGLGNTPPRRLFVTIETECTRWKVANCSYL